MCFSWTQCGCRDLSVIPRLLERISCSLLRASHLATQKNLPIGIILSFVLLTSMKLRPLLTFFSFVLYFFHALRCYNFWGHGPQSSNRTLKIE